MVVKLVSQDRILAEGADFEAVFGFTLGHPVFGESRDLNHLHREREGL